MDVGVTILRTAEYIGPDARLHGQRALLRPHGDKFVLAQFDRAPLPHLNIGWHSFPKDHFTVSQTT